MSSNESEDQGSVTESSLPAVMGSRDMSPSRAVQQVFGELVGPELHNFSGNQMEVWKQIAIACGPKVKGFDDLPEDGLYVSNFFVHPVRIDGPTPGEFTDALRCVLFNEGGDAYAFVSSVLAKDLARMVMTFGLKAWSPPLHIGISRNRGKQGHTFYTIVPLS